MGDGKDDARRHEEEARRLERDARSMEEEAHRLEDEAHRMEREAHDLEDMAREERRDEHGDHGRRERVAITVAVLNGPSPVIEAHEDEKLRRVCEQALAQTENVGRDLGEYQLKTLEGAELDLDRTVGSCDFGREVTLYLSPRAGVAGDIGCVDPEVSRAKFDEEVASHRAQGADNLARGILLLDATFPKVLVAFAAVRLRPAPLVGAAEIDFADYDFRPPSVRFVDPFTRRPLTSKEITMPVLRRVVPPASPPFVSLLVSHGPDDIPFLCLPGVREYHDNPGHSGDSWFLHRKGGEGSLAFILEKIWTYGSNVVDQFHLQVAVQAPTITVAANPDAIPS